MIDEHLIESVKLSRKQGLPQEQIYQSLLAQGKSIKDIQEAFEASESEINKVETQKRTISVVVLIGAILVAAGVFSLIASNWESFGKPLKLFLILSFMLIGYGGGWYVREVKGLAKTGAALMILGNLIYGAGIFLVAQMFNIRANWPDGFILWMLGTVFLSFATEITGVLYFAGVLGFIAIFGSPFTIWENFSGYNPLLFTSTLLLVVTTAVCFMVARNFKKKAPSEQEDIY